MTLTLTPAMVLVMAMVMGASPVEAAMTMVA